MLESTSIRQALSTVPPGRWLVGVSGGVDSVALLVALCAFRADVEPTVVHLNHEARGGASDGDADFVAALAKRLGVPYLVDRLSALPPIAEPNVEARFRRARHALFMRSIVDHDAAGVLLAHHADDRAETTLLRLLRGSEATALDGLRPTATIAGLTLVRPLLSLRRATLEAFLRDRGESWRDDASNADLRFARNRARQYLASRPTLVAPLLALADAANAWSTYVANHCATVDVADCDALADAPASLARAASRRWLRELGADESELSAAVVERLIAMATDRASPLAQTFPGGLIVRRTAGRLSASKPRVDF